METIEENEIVWLKQGLTIKYWALRLQGVLGGLVLTGSAGMALRDLGALATRILVQ
jgi:hypothetical protein